MELRDYQKEIVQKATKLLQTHQIAYLAMEVRTGKTLTSIATAIHYGATSILLVTKKKAISDIIHQGKQLNHDILLYVTNYDQLHHVHERFDMVIVDEAHSLGAFPKPSKRAQELKRICNGLPIIFLSGTPSPESYSQLFHQFWISSYSPFKEYVNFYKWAHDFVHLKKKYVYNRSINDYSFANWELIKQYTDKLMITFTQEQAGFESYVQEIVHRVKMSDMVYKLAEKLKKDKIAINPQGDVIKADTAVKLMNKLHQLYSGSIIIDEPIRTAKCIDYTKVEYIRDTFKDKKIAIFYKFIAELYAIQWIFGNKLVMDAQKFNESGKDVVFCSQIVSGREGINLSSADALVFMNIDFSALSYWQSRARMQTKDREKESHVHWIFAEHGIEDKIYQAVMDKKDYTLEHFKKDYK